MRTLILTLSLVLGLIGGSAHATEKTAAKKTAEATKKAAKKHSKHAKKAAKTQRTVTVKKASPKAAAAAKKKAATKTEKELSLDNEALPELSESDLSEQKADATTTAPAPAELTAQPKPKRINLSYYTENEINMDAANDGYVSTQRSPVTGSDTAAVVYSASPEVKIGLYQDYVRNYVIGEAPANVEFVDTQIRISHSNLFTTAGGIKGSGHLRLYVPTTQATIQRGELGHVRGYLNVAKPITNKLTFSYNLYPRYYFQQYRSSQQPDGTFAGNRHYRIHQWLETDYAFTDKVSATATMGWYDGWWYDDQANGVNNVKEIDGLTMELYSDIIVNKFISLSLGIQSVDPMGGEGAATNGAGITHDVLDARTINYKIAATFQVDI